MPLTSLKSPPDVQANYARLKRAITGVLIEGQAEIESLKVRIYWQTGWLMDRYLTEHPEGEQNLFNRLSHDLKIERSIFYRTLQFARSFPNLALQWNQEDGDGPEEGRQPVAARRLHQNFRFGTAPSATKEVAVRRLHQNFRFGTAPSATKEVAVRRLSWTHYRELLTLPDMAKRRQLARRAEAAGWSSRRLRVEINKYKDVPGKGPPNLHLLDEPKRGRSGVRRVAWLKALGGRARKVIDLGFHVYRELDPEDTARLQAKAVVTWDAIKGRWQPGGTRDDIYFFSADPEHVVDGDTLLVHVDLGFGLRRRQYLRLRGLDTESLESARGRRARDFVRDLLLKNRPLTFKSRAIDRYGRYLSDVWAGTVYLNQALLDKKLAVGYH